MSIELGLENIHRILSFLGNPQNSYSVIHVAGTNGKGSVCAVLSSILTTCGISVGRFTSPHLLSPDDTISINNIPISNQEYSKTLTTITEISASQDIKATPFELQTATAFLLFRERAVQVAVVEVGLGGRLDATNVFEGVGVKEGLIKICAFTSIGFDHMSFLGDTIEKIATEKAGILIEGVRDSYCVGAVIGHQVYKDAQEVFVKRAGHTKTPCVFAKPAIRLNANGDGDRRDVAVDFQNAPFIFRMPFLGDFQLENVATALKSFELLIQHNPTLITTPLNLELIRTGVESAKWRGRLERLVVPKLNLSILLDGAHNTAGAETLRSFLDQQCSAASSPYSSSDTERPTCWIIGLKSDKDASKILSTLLRHGDAFLSVPFTTPQDMPWVKCTDPKTLVKNTEELGLHLSYSDSFESVEKALEFVALGRRHGDDGEDGKFKREMYKNAVVCGSMYLVSDVYRTIA